MTLAARVPSTTYYGVRTALYQPHAPSSVTFSPHHHSNPFSRTTPPCSLFPPRRILRETDIPCSNCRATRIDASSLADRVAMPKVKSYSAPWLANGGPGYQLFEPSPDTLRSRGLSPHYGAKKKGSGGPRRTIARRGTEVFVAMGREIRWGDLAYLKDEWIAGQARDRPRGQREDSILSRAADEGAPGLRVRRAPHSSEHLAHP